MALNLLNRSVQLQASGANSAQGRILTDSATISLATSISIAMQAKKSQNVLKDSDSSETLASLQLMQRLHATSLLPQEAAIVVSAGSILSSTEVASRSRIPEITVNNVRNDTSLSPFKKFISPQESTFSIGTTASDLVPSGDVFLSDSLLDAVGLGDGTVFSTGISIVDDNVVNATSQRGPNRAGTFTT